MQIFYEDVDLHPSALSFSSHSVVGSSCYKFVCGYKHCGALKILLKHN